MITAYLAGIPSPYEGEDIEVQYAIYEDSELLLKKSAPMDYITPVLVGQVALQRLIGELKPYKNKEVVVMVNDTILFESVKGILQTKNITLLRMAKDTRRQVDKFANLTIQNVTADATQLRLWIDALKGL